MSNEAASGGIGFLGLLTIVFIALKLTDCITWSWLWVLAPMWMPLTLMLGMIIFIVSFGRK